MARLGFLLLLALGLLALRLPALLRAGPPPPVSVHVDAGSVSGYTAQDGTHYAPDLPWTPERGVGYVGGGSLYHNPESPAGGTPDSLLYQTERQGWEVYRISNLPPGVYVVTLHFSEQKIHGSGRSVMDVQVEGVTVLDNLDTFALVGRHYALVRRFRVDVPDGELTLTASASVGQTHLAALSVESYQPTATSATPTGLTALDGYGEILLNWADSSEADLDGYRLTRALSPDGPFVPVAKDLLHESRYQDRTVPGVRFYYRVEAVTLAGSASAPSASVSAAALPVDALPLPTYHLIVSDENLALLYDNPHSDHYVTGTVTFEGIPYPADVRFRGTISRTFSKKSWKLRFPDDSPAAPRDRLNLNADFVDISLMRGRLTTHLYEAAGVLPAEAEAVAILLNGQYLGVYTSYEEIDELFLARTDRAEDATIYKVEHSFARPLPTLATFHAAYEQETNAGLGYDDIVAFVRLINETPDSTFAHALGQALDVASYLDYYTVIVLTSNLDFALHNVYLVHDLQSDRWEVVPWDSDRTWLPAYATLPLDIGTARSPLWDGPNPLLTRTLDVPQYRAYYCRRLTQAMASFFSDAALHPQIDALYQPIEQPGLRDWLKLGWEEPEPLITSPAQLKQFAQERRAALTAQLAAYCPAQQSYLVLNEILAHNGAGLCDPADKNPATCHDPWLELYNPALEAAPLEGFYLTDDLSQPTKFRLGEGLTVPPLGHLLLWGDGEPAQGGTHLPFRLSPTGGTLALFAPDGTTLVDSISYAPQAPDIAAGRTPDGVSAWRTFRVPTPGEANRLQPPTLTELARRPLFPDAGQPVTVTVQASDDGQLLPPVLHYQVDGGGFQPLPMEADTGNLFRAQLPAQPAGTRVQYYVTAGDDDGNWSATPARAPDATGEYQVARPLPHLVMNEVLAENTGSLTDPDEEDEFPDWLELYNPGPHAVELGGLYLSDSPSNPTKVRLSDELTLAPGGYLLLYADEDPEQGPHHLNFKLSASGETVSLYDSEAGGFRLIDAVSFNEQEADVAWARCPSGGKPWVTSAPSPGASNAPCGLDAPHAQWLRHLPAFPASAQPVQVEAALYDDEGIAAAWLTYHHDSISTTLPMLFAGGTYLATVPPLPSGTLVSYFVEAEDAAGQRTRFPAGETMQHYRTDYAPPSIRLNEVMSYNDWQIPDPDEPGEFSDWVELYNASDAPLDLSGYSLSDDPANPTRYRFPAGTTIPARGFLLVWMDDDPEQGPLHAPFTLSGWGDDLALYGPDGLILIDYHRFGRQFGTRSLGRAPDGGPTWQSQSCLSPGRANGCIPLYLPVVSSQ